MELFIELCKEGKINELKTYKMNLQDIDNYTENANYAENVFGFRLSCEYGHLEVAKWLIDISLKGKGYEKYGAIDIHSNGNEYEFINSCRNGHLEIAKWLIEISQTHKEYMKFGLINIHARNEDAFINSCWYGYLKVAKWLYLLDNGKFDIKIINEQYCNIKNNKLLTRLIGNDYKNNSRIKKEYLKEYNKWKIRIIIRMSGKLIKFYNYIMEKSYSPKGVGYLRANDDFNDKINNITIKC